MCPIIILQEEMINILSHGNPKLDAGRRKGQSEPPGSIPNTVVELSTELPIKPP